MNAEDQSLARAVLRRLRPDTTANMTDAQLDADPICQWVECLFRKVRDEAKSPSQMALDLARNIGVDSCLALCHVMMAEGRDAAACVAAIQKAETEPGRSPFREVDLSRPKEHSPVAIGSKSPGSGAGE